MNKKEINEKLVDLLMKKASGFHYEEEQYEYQRSGQKGSKKNENLNFFDLLDRGDGDFEKASVKLKSKGKRHDEEELVLVKKKVTAHYIPPDMLAIKILLEMFGEKELNQIEQMTDEELLKLKNQLFEEIKNGNFED